jgi:hypothetical protein
LREPARAEAHTHRLALFLCHSGQIRLRGRHAHHGLQRAAPRMVGVRHTAARYRRGLVGDHGHVLCILVLLLEGELVRLHPRGATRDNQQGSPAAAARAGARREQQLHRQALPARTMRACSSCASSAGRLHACTTHGQRARASQPVQRSAKAGSTHVTPGPTWTSAGWCSRPEGRAAARILSRRAPRGKAAVSCLSHCALLLCCMRARTRFVLLLKAVARAALHAQRLRGCSAAVATAAQRAGSGAQAAGAHEPAPGCSCRSPALPRAPAALGPSRLCAAERCGARAARPRYPRRCSLGRQPGDLFLRGRAPVMSPPGLSGAERPHLELVKLCQARARRLDLRAQVCQLREGRSGAGPSIPVAGRALASPRSSRHLFALLAKHGRAGLQVRCAQAGGRAGGRVPE